MTSSPKAELSTVMRGFVTPFLEKAGHLNSGHMPHCSVEEIGSDECRIVSLGN